MSEGDGRPDHAPARFSGAVAVVAAGLAAATALGGSRWGLALPPLGALLVAAGIGRRDRRAVVGGCALLVCGAFASGLAGAGPGRLLVAVAATLVAGDLGDHSITLGAQLGRGADTRRLELLHAGAAVLVATVAVGGGYAVFAVARGGQPMTVLVALLVGVVALLGALQSG